MRFTTRARAFLSHLYREGATFVTWPSTLPLVGLATTTCAHERWSGSVVGPELPGPAAATTTSGEARAHGWELGRTWRGVCAVPAPADGAGTIRG